MHVEGLDKIAWQLSYAKVTVFYPTSSLSEVVEVS
jgi:hypothetical protein